MSEIVNLYKQEAKNSLSSNAYQMKIMIELFKNIKNKIFIDVGASYGYYSLIAGSLGWTVKAFEMRPQAYMMLSRNIRDNHLQHHITPIYTRIGLKPSLDQFIANQHIGLIRLNTNENINEVMEGIKDSLEHQLIDSLVVTICPRLKPTNIWIELIMYLDNHGYNVFDLKTPQIKKTDENVRLVPFNIDMIHQTSETTLLFLKKTYIHP